MSTRASQRSARSEIPHFGGDETQNCEICHTAPENFARTLKNPEKHSNRNPGSGSVTRALRSNNFWLCLTYLGLIVLIARAYA